MNKYSMAQPFDIAVIVNTTIHHSEGSDTLEISYASSEITFEIIKSCFLKTKIVKLNIFP